MRLILLAIVVACVGCGQLNTSTVSKEENQKLIAGAQTQNVVNALQQKPEWLFAGDVCPAAIMPETEIKPAYLGEGCADNPDECFNKCQQNDATACYALAVLIDEKLFAENKELNKEITPPLYLRACKLGIVSGCTNYAASKTDFAKMDAPTTACVADSFEKTCAKDDAWGCNMYGQLVGLGIGRPKDLTKAAEIFQKACNVTDAEDAACVESRQLEQIIRNEQNDANANKPNNQAVNSNVNLKKP